MGRRLYVGNLPYKATDEELTTLFSTVGDVAPPLERRRFFSSVPSESAA